MFMNTILYDKGFPFVWIQDKITCAYFSIPGTIYFMEALFFQ